MHQLVASVFPTITESIVHILAADETWFFRMKGTANHSQIIKATVIGEIEDVEKVSLDVYLELQNYLLHTDLED